MPTPIACLATPARRPLRPALINGAVWIVKGAVSFVAMVIACGLIGFATLAGS